jgi:hypothetical protein
MSQLDGVAKKMNDEKLIADLIESIEDNWFCDNPNGDDIKEELMAFVNQYKALQKENEDLKLEIARCREIAERDGKDYSDLLAQLKLAVEALEFYKDVKNYTKDGIVFSAQPCGYAEFEQVQDFGITAEQALAKIKAKGEL